MKWILLSIWMFGVTFALLFSYSEIHRINNKIELHLRSIKYIYQQNNQRAGEPETVLTEDVRKFLDVK